MCRMIVFLRTRHLFGSAPVVVKPPGTALHSVYPHCPEHTARDVYYHYLAQYGMLLKT